MPAATGFLAIAPVYLRLAMGLSAPLTPVAAIARFSVLNRIEHSSRTSADR